MHALTVYSVTCVICLSFIKCCMMQRVHFVYLHKASYLPPNLLDLQPVSRRWIFVAMHFFKAEIVKKNNVEQKLHGNCCGRSVCLCVCLSAYLPVCQLTWT